MVFHMEVMLSERRMKRNYSREKNYIILKDTFYILVVHLCILIYIFITP